MLAKNLKSKEEIKRKKEQAIQLKPSFEVNTSFQAFSNNY